MAKFYGPIGYVERIETEPGVWEDQVTERKYSGDFIRNTSKFQTSGEVNDNVDVSNEISIVSDPYAIKKFCYIRYLEYMGIKWKITNVEVKYPRLILTVGGVYNG